MSDPELVKAAAALFVKAFGLHPGSRLAHAKGIVCEGTFKATPAAAQFCRAVHFKGVEIPVVVRFSDGTGLPQIPDGAADSNPRASPSVSNFPTARLRTFWATGSTVSRPGRPKISSRSSAARSIRRRARPARRRWKNS